ncbi:SMP-30/Gluconolaconase/LRE-like region-containing protein [Limimonas halophila]|uniref:SMP-30/Gluconolaconase/LRE-like region-containing protein n=1 Tax=Limimonas halophila TaxID=1082479 RepID=A0A1G7RK86_9PROT|nr:SMP-30/gluconolactonase/LRE family protein [Limimonas halophila]SDG11103.1 SMP-30/Gluconolaconase/LRE-like region-containing protein [Limimonas halophila]
MPPRRAARAAALACALTTAAAPVPAAETCTRRPLVDAAGGAPVRGVEDLAHDPATGRLYLSAYDRWAVADATDAGERPPDGGIYAVSAAALRAGDGKLRIRKLTGQLDGAFHPHGIGFARQGGKARLFAVNHAWGKAGGGWRKRFRLAVLEPTGDSLTRVASLRDPALCRANDVAARSPTTAFVTRDHGACRGFGRWLEMTLGLDRAKLLRVELTNEPRIRTVADELAMANGVTLGPDGARLAVAETRGERIRIYDAEAVHAGPVATHPLPGGPDNLTWSESGPILAAVHDSLTATGMARYRVFGHRRAGSHVVAVDPATGGTQTLVRDRTGTRLNMATAAIRTHGRLIAAGLLDDALLVCRENDGDT